MLSAMYVALGDTSKYTSMYSCIESKQCLTYLYFPVMISEILLIYNLQFAMSETLLNAWSPSVSMRKPLSAYTETLRSQQVSEYLAEFGDSTKKKTSKILCVDRRLE